MPPYRNLVLWALVAACSRVLAQEGATGPEAIPTVVAQRIDRKPSLEEFLGMAPPADLAGKMAHVDGGFVQREPVDGDPASQHTDVYIGYDDTSLYAVFVAFDTDPAGIRANMSRRENLFGDDIVEIQIDTFHDQRRAATFICNPLGVQFDAIWTEGSDFDGSFDTVWYSKGRLTDRGYVVLMEIPFKSLRFPDVPEQTWGMILDRDIPRNNEESFWPRYTNRIQGRLNQAGILTGLRDISPGRNIQFIPYVTGRSSREVDDSGTGDVVKRGDTDVGLDTKLVFRDELVLDLTANPDFSQVESDEPQVVVNRRFEVFFPEKRPFFIENAGFFATPQNLLFTRRIGEPRVGARLTGKAGPWALGYLLIDDENADRDLPPGDPRLGEVARIGVARMSRDVLDQSNVGFLYEERRFGDDRNRVGGVDGRLKWNDHWTTVFQGVLSRTSDPEGERRGSLYDVAMNRTGRHLNLHFHGIGIEPGFESDLGFVPRTDVRDVHAQVDYTVRPEGKRLLNWTPGVLAQHLEDYRGTTLEWNLIPQLNLQFRRQTEVAFEYQEGSETLRALVDDPALTEDRSYAIHVLSVSASSRFSDVVNLDGSIRGGRGVNHVPPVGVEPAPADLAEATLTLTLRPTKRWRVDGTYLASRAEEPDGSRIFLDQIGRLRVALQIDPRTSLRVIAERGELDVDSARTSLEASRRLNVDFLFTYLVNPWTAVYAGFNSDSRNAGSFMTAPVADPSSLREDARQFFVKLSYLFRL